MCEEIKFGVGGRVHFLPFSQLAVISKPSTWCNEQFAHQFLGLWTTICINNHCQIIDFSIIFHFVSMNKKKKYENKKIKTTFERNIFTWSFRSALVSRHRVAFSILVYSLVVVASVESFPLVLFSESVNLTWPFDFSDSTCFSLVLLSVAP